MKIFLVFAFGVTIGVAVDSFITHQAFGTMKDQYEQLEAIQKASDVVIDRMTSGKVYNTTKELMEDFEFEVIAHRNATLNKEIKND